MTQLLEDCAKRLKLSQLRSHIAELTADQIQFLEQLFTREIEHREATKLNLLLKQAQLPQSGHEPFDWQHVQLAKTLLKEDLWDGQFISKKENLILYGGVGTGKTYLSRCIALNAITKFGHKVRFYTIAGLVNQLIDANQKGQLNKLMNQIDKLDLLILDELGYIPLGKEGAELLFQVISMCYEKRSIIITTNLQFGQWNHVFGNQILTEAVIDRLIHHSHLIIFTGESYRYRNSSIRK
ncbi:IS21-like element helper ATPase IstB [Lysinibacillus antri]|uniref:ATP-binding protein n=1 Tax=Lysinibacillus antri TaxID=2498145 RepID=A0A432L6S9_9BACI|nr:IS21-like element helper ATPase IstB [Lysinibacillus antri]RUL45631.1 ATP-binding protein [Lysinibacillus antri]